MEVGQALPGVWHSGESVHVYGSIVNCTHSMVVLALQLAAATAGPRQVLHRIALSVRASQPYQHHNDTRCGAEWSVRGRHG